jgi:hypothetical protein
MMYELETQNRVIGNCPTKLNQIHTSEINIAIYNRDITLLATEINALLKQNVEIRATGDTNTIKEELDILNVYPLVQNDILYLIDLFKEITNADNFRILLSTVNTNMCRKFHTDMNDLRLLCTYSGPGTLWLNDDNVNREALDSHYDNECIVLDESKIRQAATGAVVILKGAIYPGEATNAIVHRSPSIEESGERRLLLRIDTNDILSFG